MGERHAPASTLLPAVRRLLCQGSQSMEAWTSWGRPGLESAVQLLPVSAQQGCPALTARTGARGPRLQDQALGVCDTVTFIPTASLTSPVPRDILESQMRDARLRVKGMGKREFSKVSNSLDLKKKKIVFIFRGEGRKKKRERNFDCERIMNRLPLTYPQPRDLAPNPGMCPDRESNRQPFSLQDSAQPTEPHQPGLA